MNRTKKMLGLVGFDALKIKCIIGDLPEERTKEQNIFVDLRIEFDYAKVAQSDDLKDTINYVMLSDLCQNIARTGQYQMLERYAVEVLKRVLLEEGVHSAWIRVKKPQAMVGVDFAVIELKMANE